MMDLLLDRIEFVYKLKQFTYGELITSSVVSSLIPIANSFNWVSAKSGATHNDTCNYM